MGRATAPTTVLPQQQMPPPTHELTKPRQRKALIAGGALVAVAIAVAGYF